MSSYSRFNKLPPLPGRDPQPSVPKQDQPFSNDEKHVQFEDGANPQSQDD